LVFNFWANETNLTIRSIPNTASGVIYFNQTFAAQKVLTAWAEAMAYEKNVKAPDDQVLDVLLVNGWLERASYGWLPAAYLRTMPAYYRGVKAVIDHDHGNAPGLISHSSDKAVLPPIAGLEKLKVGNVAGIKCLATMEGGSDSWCTNSCNDPSGITNPSATTCPTKLCVCDWKGDWPEEDDGEVNWADTSTLGVGGSSPSADDGAAAIARAVAKSLGAGTDLKDQGLAAVAESQAAAAEIVTATTRTSLRETTKHAHRRVAIDDSVSSADASASRKHHMDDGHGHKHTLDDGHRHGDEFSREPAEAEPAVDLAATRKHSIHDGHGHGPLGLKRANEASRGEQVTRHKSEETTTMSI
jgi:hypothetical protein